MPRKAPRHPPHVPAGRVRLGRRRRRSPRSRGPAPDLTAAHEPVRPGRARPARATRRGARRCAPACSCRSRSSRRSSAPTPPRRCCGRCTPSPRRSRRSRCDADPRAGRRARVARARAPAPSRSRAIDGSLASTQRPAPIASITKLVTALLVLDELPLAVGEQGPEYRFTCAGPRRVLGSISRAGESALDVPVGGTLTEYQMLEGMLIGSANNYADRLAGDSVADATPSSPTPPAPGSTRTACRGSRSSSPTRHRLAQPGERGGAASRSRRRPSRTRSSPRSSRRPRPSFPAPGTSRTPTACSPTPASSASRPGRSSRLQPPLGQERHDRRDAGADVRRRCSASTTTRRASRHPARSTRSSSRSCSRRPRSPRGTIVGVVDTAWGEHA